MDGEATMKAHPLLPVILLVVGLVVGFGGGAAVRPATVTETRTEIATQTAVSTVWATAVVTAIQTVRETLLGTTTAVQTLRMTDTVTETRTTTVATTVYPAESGDILVTDKGSGNKDTKPFTLDKPSDLKITVRVTARGDLRYVSLAWYLYNVDAGKWIRNGEVNGEEGVFEFYATNIPSGNWYVKILAANCNWELTVEKVT
jgi:hypothetical protein